MTRFRLIHRLCSRNQIIDDHGNKNGCQCDGNTNHGKQPIVLSEANRNETEQIPHVENGNQRDDYIECKHFDQSGNSGGKQTCLGKRKQKQVETQRCQFFPQRVSPKAGQGTENGSPEGRFMQIKSSFTRLASCS